ncbi:unnamed protein product [Miscanthus lutarioriparius]|uniref:protein-serine/threonine phosphatase n=1 Tax=Miscanthus lutarioriparius TaxID=422564 RepID=A0A811NC67_9POAL|nr:unnamed protein product [Miscanthus lutarioriparius]
MAHQKREGSSADDDCTSKRLKGTDTASETGGSVEASVSQQMDAEARRTCQKESKVPSDKCIPDGEAAANSQVLGEQKMVLTAVEADTAEDKGCRHTMEDTWVVLPDGDAESPGSLRCAHFAIYDGHGGRLAADYAQKHLHQNVIAAGLPRELMDVKAAKKAVIEGIQCIKVSVELMNLYCKKVLKEIGKMVRQLYVFGFWDRRLWLRMLAGDAKAVLARSISTEGEGVVDETKSQLKAIVLTREHKAIFPQERSRIQKSHFVPPVMVSAGGSVGSNGRLQGRIEVSRAFGDRHFKKVFGPGDAVEFVQNQLKETSSATLAVRRLVKEAVRERRCKDNCTAVLIVFKH